ncbi:MAG: ATP-grasp domain-containing protein [Pirellulaceae bacterium]|nr:ATP-grasp domain-containing protein [Pirellulaceae bacterium]
MKPRRILVLVREGLVPPESMEGYSDKEIAVWKVEYDVVTTLREMGHEVRAVGVFDDLSPIRRAIREWRPHIAFMMLEEFHGLATYDSAVVAYLELMRTPYTGCNPRGLMLSRDKAVSKKILRFHRIPTPRFAVCPRRRSVKKLNQLRYPLIVKSVIEDASFGIAQASVVRDHDALVERVEFVHRRAESDALVEEFIEGRELYVGVIGNQRLQTFPVWEMLFPGMPDDVARIATAKVKFDGKYQERYGITTKAADDLPPPLVAKIERICKRVYHALSLSGYARIDLRMDAEDRIYVLEANANPNLEYGEDFAESAESMGIGYEELLQRIVNLGIRHDAPWKNAPRL